MYFTPLDLATSYHSCPSLTQRTSQQDLCLIYLYSPGASPVGIQLKKKKITYVIMRKAVFIHLLVVFVL